MDLSPGAVNNARMKRAVLVLAAFACGCSLEERGLQASDGAPPIDATYDSTLPDAGDTDATIDDSGPSTDVVVLPDVNDDAPVADAGPCQTPSTGCPSLGGGAKIVIHETSTALNCPAGWTKTDRATNAQPLGGACGCRCNPTLPSCKPSQLSITDGANSGCGGGGTAQVNYSGNCANTTLNLKSYLQVAKIPAVGAACTPDTLANGGQITFTTVRSCTPPPACLGDVCSGTVPPGFAACIDLPGDVPCNTLGYQTTRTVVGTGAALNCGIGSCACSSSPSCAGNVQFFSQPNCAVLSTTIQADDVCVPGNYQNGSTMQSVRYNPTATAGCASSGNATASTTLTFPHTICCK